MWRKRLYGSSGWHVHFNKSIPIIVYNNSHGVVALSKNSVHNNALKHVDIRYHFRSGLCNLNFEKISTIDNISDKMTKSLAVDQFRSLRHQMGLRRNHVIESDKRGTLNNRPRQPIQISLPTNGFGLCFFRPLPTQLYVDMF